MPEPTSSTVETPLSLAERCKALNELREAIALAETSLRKMKAERDKEALALADAFAEQGIQSMSVDGRSYYITNLRHCRKRADVPMEDACRVLKACELGDFVKESFNWQSIESYAREAHDELDPGTPFIEALPEPLRPLFETHEFATVRSRSS